MTRRVHFAVAAWLGVSASLEAQAPPTVPQTPPPLVLKTTTRLVPVSVIVQHKGQPVADLHKEDFEVYDRGKLQQIAVFAVDTSAVTPRGAASASLPPNVFSNRIAQRTGIPSNVTVILLDSLNTKFTDQAYARNQVIAFLKQLQPEDRVAIYTLGRGLRVLHDYTSDASLLVKRLASYNGESLPALAASEGSSFEQGELQQLDNWIGGRGGASGMEADFYMINRVRGTLKALEFIANHLAGIPGRKNLIWLSGGFPLTIGFDSIEEMHNPARTQMTFGDEIDQAVRAINNANVAVYPVDARGLMTDPRFSAQNAGAPKINPGRLAPPVGVKNQQTMQELADRTGGRAYYNTNDLKHAIRDAMHDSEVTYTLGYYANDAKFDGKFHEIKVKVKRPGVSVRFRKGYFDMAEQPQDDKSRKADLRDAVFSPIDATELGLAVILGKNPDQAASFVVGMKVEPEGLRLQSQDGRWAGKLDILVTQLDERGRQYNGVDDTIDMRLTQPNYEKVVKEGLLYRKVLDRSPRATKVRVIVRDASSGAVGSVTVAFSDVKPPL